MKQFLCEIFSRYELWLMYSEASERAGNHTKPGQAQAGTVVLYVDELENGDLAGIVTIIYLIAPRLTSLARVLIAFTTPSMAVGTYASDDQRPKVSEWFLLQRFLI